MRRTCSLLPALVLVLALTACGGGDDGAADGSGSPAGGADPVTGDPAAPDMEDCTYEANDGSGGIVAGTVTVAGVNDTGADLDTVTITFGLLGPGGAQVGEDQGTNVAFWRDGEEIATVASYFSEEPVPEADCEVVAVRTGRYAEGEEFDAGAAGCRVEAPEAGRGPAELRVDITGVGDAPEGEDLLATVAVLDGDVRVQDAYVNFADGATEASTSVVVPGDGLACEVLQVRRP